MPFRPAVHEELIINGTIYSVAPHPQSPNYPFAQEGGRATVYRLDSPHASRALKVFKQLYRTSQVEITAARLSQYATLTGLGVCNREVLTPGKDGTPPLSEPDLEWSVLMPWVEGSTWYDILIETDDRKRNIDITTMRTVVQKFLNILLEMELNAVTHCDLSPGNILVRFWPPEVDLIDVEEICAAGVPMPEILPKGTPGYTHRSASDGMWHPYADRFAGAILLCEMICWSDEYFRTQVHGDSFFDPDEMQEDTPRYQVMYRTLTQLGGVELAKLFEQCWFAQNLSETPAFWEWARGMQDYFKKVVSIQPPIKEKIQAQLTHTLQELKTRVQQPDVKKDVHTRAAYQRVQQRLEYDMAKLSGKVTTPPPTPPVSPPPTLNPQAGAPISSSAAVNWQRLGFVAGSTVVSVAIAGYVVFGLLASNPNNESILPQVVITVLPNNETLTPSYTLIPTETETASPTIEPTAVPTSIPPTSIPPTRIRPTRIIPTDTAVPLPTDTAVPLPTDTAVPLPTDTAVPLPTDTPPPQQSRPVPQPTSAPTSKPIG
jgi:serine/threonine protein kinase